MKPTRARITTVFSNCGISAVDTNSSRTAATVLSSQPRSLAICRLLSCGVSRSCCAIRVRFCARSRCRLARLSWRACEAAGVEPRTIEYHGDDPLGWVVSLNLHRRHLDESQRSLVAAKIATLPKGVRSDTPIGGSSTTQEGAAQLLNVGTRSVQRAREVLDHGSDELIGAVESGRVSVSAAADVAQLPMPVQSEIVARGEREIIETAKRLRQRKTAEVVARNDALRREAAAIPFPAGQYQTVVIDPPWPMKIIERDVRPGQVGMHYPTMSIDEIKAIELPLAEQATVYLWSTQRFLPDAFEVLRVFDDGIELRAIRRGG